MGGAGNNGSIGPTGEKGNVCSFIINHISYRVNNAAGNSWSEGRNW